MNKTKAEIYKEVLRDVSQNFDGAEDFIKKRIEEIYVGKKLLKEVSFCFCL